MEPLIAFAERRPIHSVTPNGSSGFQRSVGDEEVEVAFIVSDGHDATRVVVILSAAEAAGLAIHLLSSTTRKLRRREADALIALASQVPA